MALTKVTNSMIRSAPVNVLDYMTDAQITSVLAYNFSVDVTIAVQAALDAAWAANLNCYLPAGGYKVSTITLPGNSSNRNKGFRMYGQGTGEIFALVQNNLTAGTILYSTTDAPVLQYLQDSPNTGGGNVEIDHIMFYGTTTSAYIVDLRSLYVESSFHHNNIYQGGTGGGFRGVLIGSSDIYQVYSINKDWLTNGLGVARTGNAFSIEPNIDYGLTQFRRCTGRGFLTAFNIGGFAGRPISVSLRECEASVTYNGVVVNTNAIKTLIDECYFEGGDGGTGVKDQGEYTTISNNIIFEGYAKHIDASDTNNYGTLIYGNAIGIGSVANAIAISVASSGAYGGPGKTVRDNYIAFSGSGGSIAGVNGIKISGVDPRIDLSSNVFVPRGPWVGGAGTTKINDISTSSASASLNGDFGFGVHANGNYEFPAVRQGSYGFGIPDTALADAAVSAGVLSTGLGSFFVLTLTGTANITSFNMLQQGQMFKIHATNNKPTFKQGANIKLAGSADYTPGANGAILTFVINGTSGGIPVAYECDGRVAF